MKVPLPISIVVLLVSLAAAQSGGPAAEIQDLKVTPEGEQLNIAVTLTSPVTPSVIVATGPDRLVLDLPNTTADAKQKRIPVNQGVIKAVRVGLNSANPPVTRVVIDLNQARPYHIASNGNTITLTILPAESASHERRSAPVPAASAPIWGHLKPPRKKESVAGPVTDSASATIVPPKPFPPLQLPNGQTISGNSSTAPVASNTRPSATHPSFGSLQQGTVYPGAGSPGSGYVPPAANSSSTLPPGAITSATSSVPLVANARTAANASEPAIVTTTVVAHVESVTPPAAKNPQPVEPSAVVAPAPIVAPAPTVAKSVSDRPYPELGEVAPPRPQPAVAVIASEPAGKSQTASVTVAPDATSATTTTTASPTAEPTVPTSGATVTSAAPSAAPVTATANDAAAASTTVASPGSSTETTSPATQPATVVASAEPAPNPAATAVTAESAAAAPKSTSQPDENLPALSIRQPNSDIRMGFKVKYVAAGVAYLEGGHSAGLAEGMKLQVRDNLSKAPSGTNEAYGPEVADLEVLSVADTSTVAEIHDPKRDVKAGDWAYLSPEDTQTLVAERSLSPTRKYPVVVSFTEGSDPLAEEAHAEVPRPPMPDINRARGRFGFDYSSIMSQGNPGVTSSSLGLSVRTDITRIGGTYWNMSGYWRGRLTKTSATSQPQTLQDLINRTYHMALTYDSPTSHLVAGFGRLYLPYATSLDTIDGGYVGYRIAKGATIGLFAGSTPDPTSYSYNPQQELGGTFVNFAGGSWDQFRYSDTFGLGIEMLKWKINRPFVFGENTLSYKRVFSLYSAVQADSPTGNPAVAAPGAGLSRSFTTFRIQPFSRIEFDLNHTYFRDIPTYDPTLLSTGLLDKYLFQGFSGGTRVEVLKQIWLYTTIGKSSRSGDTSSALNQMYGISFGHLPRTRIHSDFHYSKFSSSFGSGTYYSASISRNFHETYMWEVLAGQQSYVSSVASNDKSHFVTGNVEAPLGSHYYVQSGFTWNRGGTQNYNQMLFSFGYRFDTRSTKSK